jgi:catechol 2,3-dioxygenase-like lactoylglutathione lyase family enzyme
MILGIIHVNINCTDIERSVAFYEKLGFRVVHVFSDEKSEESLDPEGDLAAGMTGPGGTRSRGCVLSLGDDPRSTTKIELIQYLDPPAVAAPEKGLRESGVSRVALRTKNLLAFAEKLRSQGVEFMSEPQEIDVVGAQRFVLFRDPDGVILELIEF